MKASKMNFRIPEPVNLTNGQWFCEIVGEDDRRTWSLARAVFPTYRTAREWMLKMTKALCVSDDEVRPDFFGENSTLPQARSAA